jgi:hypothetical protein
MVRYIIITTTQRKSKKDCYFSAAVCTDSTHDKQISTWPTKGTKDKKTITGFGSRGANSNASKKA